MKYQVTAILLSILAITGCGGEDRRASGQIVVRNQDMRAVDKVFRDCEFNRIDTLESPSNIVVTVVFTKLNTTTSDISNK